MFIILADVQYSSGTWRNRNKIKTDNGLKWLTVPIIRERLAKLICETRIDYAQKWGKSHMDQIRFYYKKAPFFSCYFDEYCSLIEAEYPRLSELNFAAIRWIMEKLGITTPTIMSEELNVPSEKTDRVINLIKKVNASTYLSGPVAQGYLDLDKFKQAGIGLEYKTYDYLP